MKTEQKTQSLKEGTQKTGNNKKAATAKKSIKTDFTLSEKDEVKQAEEKMRTTRPGIL